jgi:hypothetical protein
MQVTVKAITPCKTGNFMITFVPSLVIPGVGKKEGTKHYFYIDQVDCQVNDVVNLDMSMLQVVDKQGKNSEGVDCTFKVLELKL